MKGLVSPWGSRASICAHFHWTYEYLLWGISWINVELFLVDLPTFEYGEPKDKINKIDNKEQMQDYLKSLM